MRQRKGPESEVRGSVGDSAENKFDCFDQLVDESFAEVEFVLNYGFFLVCSKDRVVFLFLFLG